MYITHSIDYAMLLRLLILLPVSFLSIAFSSAKGKQEPRADIRVSYNYHEKYLKGNTDFAEHDIPMLLLVNSGQSKFYCPFTEYMDSLDSTPSGQAAMQQMMDIAVQKYLESGDESAMNSVNYKTFMYVFKDYGKELSTVYDKAGMMEYGVYEEPFSELVWEIGDSLKTVLGYKCVRATADYHGRRWTAWFVPEIPVSDGPWKLRGLPGIILEAVEDKGQHSFVADGIEETSQPMCPVYNRKNYDKMSRKDMLRQLRNYSDNGNSMVSALIGLELGPDAPAQTEYDFLETDYR